MVTGGWIFSPKLFNPQFNEFHWILIWLVEISQFLFYFRIQNSILNVLKENNPGEKFYLRNS